MNNSLRPVLSGLIVLAHYHGIATNPADILHHFSASKNSDLTQIEWLLAAKKLQLKAKVVRQSLSRLAYITLPALVWQDNGEHYILAKIDGSDNTAKYLIQDLHQNKPIVLDSTQFAARYSGSLILVTSRASVLGSLAKFDFTWFIPAVIKYRRIFIEVLLVSVVLQIFALIAPFV